MGKLGEIAFHPQDQYTQQNRREIIAILKADLRGQHGYYYMHTRIINTSMVKCRDPWGYSKYSTRKGTFSQRYDFDVTRLPPASPGEKRLKIKGRKLPA